MFKSSFTKMEVESVQVMTQLTLAHVATWGRPVAVFLTTILLMEIFQTKLGRF